VEEELNEEEKWRNGQRLDQVYVGGANPITPEMYDLGSKAEHDPNGQASVQIDPVLFGALPPPPPICPESD